MAKRNRDWRDLLTAYTYAIDGKKVFLGFMALLFGAVLFMVMAAAYRPVFGIGYRTITAEDPEWQRVAGPWRVVDVDVEGNQAVEVVVMEGEQEDDYTLMMEAGTVKRAPMGLARLVYIGAPGGPVRNALALLNPFGRGVLHAVFAFITWFLLLWICTGKGGAISRLTALEYARDELPTLADGTMMVRERRLDFFLAPVTPLIGVICMWACLVIGGLIASIPYVGMVLMVPGYVLCLLAGLVMTFLVVVGLLSIGLMMPAMAVNGKGAFDSWTAAYTYVIWGFSRFVVYKLITGFIGLVSLLIVGALTLMLLGMVDASVDMGYVGESRWILDTGAVARGTDAVLPAIVYFIKLLVLAVPAAYAFSYYWAASTVVFMLLRKHVDNVEFDQICEAVPETPEEGEAELEITQVEPEGEEPIADEDVTAPAEAALEEEPEGLDMTSGAPENAEPQTSEAVEEAEEAEEPEEEAEEPEPPQTAESVEEEQAPAQEAAEPGEQEEDERKD